MRSAKKGPPPELHKIGYERVSTQDQNLALQHAALLKDGVAEPDIYRDVMSGANQKRPGFNAMMRDLRAGDVVTVWKLDRLSRSLPAMLWTLAEIEERGAHLRIITQQIDTSTAAGRMFLHMLGVIADFEREIGRERTLAGLARARAEGRLGGRPPRFTDEQIGEALAVRRSGRSWAAAASSIGISIPSLHRRAKALREKEKKDD